MSAADKLKKKFGDNLSESLGVRTVPSASVSTPVAQSATVSPDDGRTRARETGHLELDRLVADPNQPRKEFDPESLDRLAASMLRYGQLQPIRVRWDGALGKWVVIAGQRRYEAARRAGMRTLVCVFVDRALTPEDVLSEQIVENLLREDLKPIEQATAYRTLMDLNHWTASQLAEALNVSKATVSRVLPLLALPDDLKEHVEKGSLSSTVAYELTKLPTADGQRVLAERIIAERFTRAEAIEVVRQETDQPAAGPVAPVVTATAAVPEALREFRRETENPLPGFAAKRPDGQSATAVLNEGSVTLSAASETTEDAPLATPVVRKGGRPRTGAKERRFRVKGARVVVSFFQVPQAAEVVTALEQALAQARADMDSRPVA